MEGHYWVEKEINRKVNYKKRCKENLTAIADLTSPTVVRSEF